MAFLPVYINQCILHQTSWKTLSTVEQMLVKFNLQCQQEPHFWSRVIIEFFLLICDMRAQIMGVSVLLWLKDDL